MKKMNLVLGAVLAGAASMAVADSLFVDATGNIGVGTNTPADKLHVLDGNFRVEQTGAGVAAKLNFITANGTWEMKQNGNTGRMQFSNSATAGAPLKFDPQAQDNLLKVGTDAADTVTITGKLVINGTEVNVPDYVFEDSYKLPSIEEQASFMFKNKHLPSVKKADADLKARNIDILSQQMAVLEELEKAHIYISQLNDTVKEMKSEIAALKAVQK